MSEIRTILCPVDFSEATSRQIDFGVDLCRLFGARLVLHHNLEHVGDGAAVGWMWRAAHPNQLGPEAAEKKLDRLLEAIPEGIEGEARLSTGPPASAVLIVRELVGADVILLTNHGTHREDHGSITEQVLERSLGAVLALHEASVDHSVPRFGGAAVAEQRMLVPASFSGSSIGATDFAFDLARRLPLGIDLLHVEPARGKSSEPSPTLAEEDRRRMFALVPADLADRARVHVAVGDPAVEIAAAAERLGTSLIVMGEHTRAPLRRWFHRDTGRAVLHRAHCPIWYVPGVH
jgi:nucleotide-binding universal stress UspA family protein